MKPIFRRYLLFTVALFFNAMGVAFITKALLGTSPISSLMYVLSMFTPLTMGGWTIVINLLFVALEMPMMTRQELRDDRTTYLLQIPISLLNGLFIDLGMALLDGFVPTAYWMQLASLATGCVILAFGISFEVKASVALISGEYLVRVISRRLKREFGYVKLGFDVTLVTLAAIFSLAFMHGIYGLREGTVIAALIVGPIVAFIAPYINILDKWLADNAQADAEPAPLSTLHTPNYVITIARELGSGGRELGQMLSGRLGIPLYDRQLIREAAAKSGIDANYIEANEQRIPSYLVKLLTPDGSNRALKECLSSEDVLYLAQSAVIRDLAEQGPCIILGRCADHVLKDRAGVLRVFCHASLDSEIDRCVNDYGMSPVEAVERIRSVNQNRSMHYHHFAGRPWADPSHYDLVLNTSTVPLPLATDLVAGLYGKLAVDMPVPVSGGVIEEECSNA